MKCCEVTDQKVDSILKVLINGGRLDADAFDTIVHIAQCSEGCEDHHMNRLVGKEQSILQNLIDLASRVVIRARGRNIPAG